MKNEVETLKLRANSVRQMIITRITFKEWIPSFTTNLKIRPEILNIFSYSVHNLKES